MIHCGIEAYFLKSPLSSCEDNSSYSAIGLGLFSMASFIVAVPRRQTSEKPKYTIGMGPMIQKIRTFRNELHRGDFIGGRS